MKKFIAAGLITLFLTALTIVPAFAADTYGLTGPTTAQIGDTVAYNVIVPAETVGVDIKLTFNPAVLELELTNAGTDRQNCGVTVWGDPMDFDMNSHDTIRILSDDPTAARLAAGKVATIKFKVIGAAGDTAAFTFKEIMIIDGDANDIAATLGTVVSTGIVSTISVSSSSDSSNSSSSALSSNSSSTFSTLSSSSAPQMSSSGTNPDTGDSSILIFASLVSLAAGATIVITRRRLSK